jgi:hypothetical protein
MTNVLPSTAGYVPSSQGESSSLNGNNTATKMQKNAPEKSAPAGDVIKFSNHAQALLQQTSASKAVAADLSVPFKERLAKRMSEFAAELSDFFKKNFIPAGEELSFNIDRYGTIHVNGAYKAKMEEYFQANPEAAHELKGLSALNTLESIHEALRLYNEEKKKAVSKEQQDAVADRYAVQMTHIETLTGLMFFKDGKLTSAAMEFAASLSAASA